eukprot:scaffold4823_cov98-Isochrysis_galbana.AAC.4
MQAMLACGLLGDFGWLAEHLEHTASLGGRAFPDWVGSGGGVPVQFSKGNEPRARLNGGPRLDPSGSHLLVGTH